MAGENLDALHAPVAEEALQTVDSPLMEEASLLVEQAPVCDLVCERVLECVPEIAPRSGLIQELRLL
jgi:hypothetical protein